MSEQPTPSAGERSWSVPVTLPGKYFWANFLVSAPDAVAARQAASTLADSLSDYSHGQIVLAVGEPVAL